jgi:hypothetical protein
MTTLPALADAHPEPQEITSNAALSSHLHARSAKASKSLHALHLRGRTCSSQVLSAGTRSCVIVESSTRRVDQTSGIAQSSLRDAPRRNHMHGDRLSCRITVGAAHSHPADNGSYVKLA